MSSPPTGTVTFLFTDIEDSTKLWERNPKAMQLALARHDEILREAIDVRRGYVFKTVGDAFCAVFPTAQDALEAALTAQRVLFSEEWSEEIGSLRVRMALHTGEADERDGDYFGPPLNRVARLLSTGHGGQVLLSRAAQELVREQLPEETALRDLGERRLKDLFRPEKIFQLTASDLPSEFPPLRTLESSSNNLPLQPTPLVGREREVAEVAQRLSASPSRLLTLTGPGGTGKTRLALQAAADLLEEFEDGAFFISLAALTEPKLVASAVAAPLGVIETADRPLEEGLKEYLREKKLLLLLDNFEQILEGASLVRELLSVCPNLMVLATSRTPLGIYGEREYPVPPLSLPDTARLPSLEDLTQYEAVRLFIERASDARPDFSITNENASAVAEICARLDGLPLAIELAAARVKVLTPEKMLERLSDRLKVLTGGARDLPERQRTLRATMEWSHALLEEGEKLLFARLSVFAGGRTLEAIEAICDAEDDLPVDILDAVESLVDKGLLREEETGGEPRFYMLETVHEYAREKLEESGEAEELRMLHAQYFLSLAEEAESEVFGPREMEWFDRLEEELDNIRVAFSWMVGGANPELGLRLAGALRLFWHERTRYGEWRGLLEEALTKAGVASPVARAKALVALGWLAFGQGDLDRMRESAIDGLRLSEEAEFPASLRAIFLTLLGHTCCVEGDYKRAIKLLEEGLALGREADDAEAIAYSLTILVWALGGQENYERAKEFFEEGLALSQERGNTFWYRALWGNFGQNYLDQGDLVRATAHFEEDAALEREAGGKRGIMEALTSLAQLALMRGDLKQAKALFEESLTLSREVGTKIGAVNGLEGLACVAGAEGQDLRAARLFGSAEALMEATGYPLLPQESAMLEPYRASVRSRLGDAGWDEALAEGRAMSLEEVAEYALSEEEHEPPTLVAMAEQHQPPPQADQPTETLTARELEIALLVGRGLTNRQIATELSISEHTAATHVRRILKKLGLQSRAQIGSWLTQQRP
jgi:predicted ATPase/class 3 adenylate cyclase/DNA-binding CsgD family transcriptional regulator